VFHAFTVDAVVVTLFTFVDVVAGLQFMFPELYDKYIYDELILEEYTIF
jgi:hypothetical protein